MPQTVAGATLPLGGERYALVSDLVVAFLTAGAARVDGDANAVEQARLLAVAGDAAERLYTTQVASAVRSYADQRASQAADAAESRARSRTQTEVAAARAYAETLDAAQREYIDQATLNGFDPEVLAAIVEGWSDVETTDATISGLVTGTNTTTRAALDAAVDARTRTGARPIGRGELMVTPAEFGAVGDGVTNDTTALAAFFTHLGANGGRGTMQGKDYRTTQGINLHNPARGFHLDGEGARILFDRAASANVINTTGLRNTLVENLTVEATGTAPASHGFAAADPTNLTLRRVRVIRYTNTGIIIYRSAASLPNPVDNHIDACTVDGTGLAQNGILFQSCDDSAMSDCVARGFNRAGSPVFGLQLKNDCTNCTIRGGAVYGAIAGVALGADGTYQHRGHTITGVRTFDCDCAFVASSTVNTEVSVQADQAGRNTGLPVIRILGSCSGVRVTATIDNIHPAHQAAWIASSDCEIVLTRMNAYPTTLAHFGGGTTRTTVRANVPPERATFSSGSGSSPNIIVGDRQDTGSRDITNLITGWVDKGSASCRLRRIGGLVILSIQARNPEVPGQFDMLTLPAGFRPAFTQNVPLQAANAPTPAAILNVPTTGVVSAYQAVAQTPWANAVAVFPTNDTWPSTLPGA